jgi:hypothetical protein
MKYKITEIKTGKELTQQELALQIYKEGKQHIIYCDIEGIAEIDGTYYILDECGNWAYIDEIQYKIERIP